MTAQARALARLRARLMAHPRRPAGRPGLRAEDEADVALSRAARVSLHSDRWVRDRLHALRSQAPLRARRIPLTRMDGWSIDPATGNIAHQGGRFFTILGVTARHRRETGDLHWDQPCIDQPEIGILGILAARFDGLLHFCLKAKEEPGNLHGVQLSPTVQATYSNYTGGHGGRRPLLVDYFLHPPPARILFARLQTEDGGRFLYKSNRNLIVRAEDGGPPGLPERFLWLTLRQISDLLQRDNVINACTRSVLSALL